MKHSKISRKTRVVVDTNVWISGIVFGGKPEQVLRYLLDDEAELIISEELVTELRQKMTGKFPDYLAKFDRLEASIRKDVRIVKLEKSISPIARDPDDDKFIETALAGKADYIISGDKDLLELGTYQGVAIVRPSDFLALVET